MNYYENKKNYNHHGHYCHRSWHYQWVFLAHAYANRNILKYIRFGEKLTVAQLRITNALTSFCSLSLVSKPRNCPYLFPRHNHCRAERSPRVTEAKIWSRPVEGARRTVAYHFCRTSNRRTSRDRVIVPIEAVIVAVEDRTCRMQSVNCSCSRRGWTRWTGHRVFDIMLAAMFEGVCVNMTRHIANISARSHTDNDGDECRWVTQSNYCDYGMTELASSSSRLPSKPKRTLNM